MLVVCALALVVAAAVYLVMGLVDGAVGDLYLSMALCAASLVVLAVSARVSRVRPPKAANTPPPPDAAPVEAAAVEAPEPVLVGVAAGAPATPAPAPAAEARVPAAAPAPDPRPQVEDDPRPEVEVEAPVPVAAEAASMWAPAGDEPFPIADYDELEGEQVLPLVGRLWPEEIPVVVARERATKARPEVLDALAAAADEPAFAFPISAYSSLDTAQITGLLDELDHHDLEIVRVAERSGPARVGVLVAVADRLARRR